MMKRRMILLLVLALLLSLCACTPDAPESTATGTPSVPTTEAAPLGTIDDISLQQMLYLFDDLTGLGLAAYCQQSEITAENVGSIIGSQEFQLPFEEGLALMPAVSIDPFVLTIFRLAEDADAEAFAAELKAKADPNKWVCVQASVVEAMSAGRTVLFFMSNDNAAPLKAAFAQMSEPGFRPEDHIIDRLADKSMAELYEELYAQYGIEQYGFLDGKECGEITPETGFDLTYLDPDRIADTFWDAGYYPAEEWDGERSYLLVMLRLNPGTDAAAFAEAFQKLVNTDALRGDGIQTVIAWSEDVICYFAGAGSLAWSNSALEMTFSGTYRMQTAGVES